MNSSDADDDADDAVEGALQSRDARESDDALRDADVDADDAVEDAEHSQDARDSDDSLRDADAGTDDTGDDAQQSEDDACNADGHARDFDDDAGIADQNDDILPSPSRCKLNCLLYHSFSRVECIISMFCMVLLINVKWRFSSRGMVVHGIYIL